jgi:hypothetical protein
MHQSRVGPPDLQSIHLGRDRVGQSDPTPHPGEGHNMNRKPDFIVIGAMKCATSTLHEQLARQPGIFMSQPKEPNFFSNDEIYSRGLDWYYSLFDGAALSDLRGESSTHYTKLPTYPKTVERLRVALPRMKLIYIMRHPVDRLISQYLHECTQKIIRVPIDAALDSHPELIAYSRYSMQLKPFLTAYGPENILPVFFERLVSHPEEELERICRFLGYQGQPHWSPADATHNVSSERLRRCGWRDAIVEAPLLKTIRRRLVPKSWRDRIRELWQIKERPQLAPASMARVQTIFDQDLAQLGGWLGIELSCEQFRTVAQAEPSCWIETAKLPFDNGR